MALSRGILVAACLLCGQAQSDASGPDTSRFRLVFDKKFHGLDLRGPAKPDGRWDTRFSFGGRSLPTNGELQLYVDRGYRGLGLNPFSLKDGKLTITARRAAPEVKGKIGGYDFTSGLLTTEHSFAQTYGYFEIRARMPAGKGLWPAFWLLPQSRQWPPEIDVFEVLGDRPDVLHMAIHSTDVHDVGFQAVVPDLSRDFHVFGVLWGPETIAWYFDGAEAARAPTPRDMHKPMYLLINLAVGGTWPGNPDSTTRFPAAFTVAYVRAYATPDTR